jgi:hypothetical protein
LEGIEALRLYIYLYEGFFLPFVGIQNLGLGLANLGPGLPVEDVPKPSK